MKLSICRSYLILAFLIAVSSCTKEYDTIEQEDDRAIKSYMKANSIDFPQYANTGIYYKIVNPASGSALAYNQEVAIVYTMRSVDGKYEAADTIFTNRYANYLGYLVPEGFRIGVKDILQKGRGKIRLLIPSRLGFGRNGDGKVPGNASLDVLLEVMDKGGLAQYNEGVIKQFLQTNNLTGFSRTSTGLYYKVTTAGTGATASPEAQITINYTGKLLDGRLFDYNNDAIFYLDRLIDGWQQGIPLVQEGGTIRLIIPSSLAYGFKASSNIPPFSCLDFEIKVSKVAN
jgi:FKBP-type peptidyl-prolyl cis-trans isomerase FkpA